MLSACPPKIFICDDWESPDFVDDARLHDTAIQRLGQIYEVPYPGLTLLLHNYNFKMYEYCPQYSPVQLYLYSAKAALCWCSVFDEGEDGGDGVTGVSVTL